MNIDDSIAHCVTKLANQCLQQHKWLATAESCTGGMIAQVLTDLPGSSAWFDCGFITYSNTAKQRLLDVSPRLLDLEGAVSRSCVDAMVLGTLHHSKADCAVACSGIAGPTGGTPAKPVGSVWLAWGYRTDKGIEVSHQHFHFDGNRHEIRQQTTLEGLRGLINLLDG